MIDLRDMCRKYAATTQVQQLLEIGYNSLARMLMGDSNWTFAFHPRYQTSLFRLVCDDKNPLSS